MSILKGVLELSPCGHQPFIYQI